MIKLKFPQPHIAVASNLRIYHRMVCKFCCRLFQFQEEVTPYTPPKKLGLNKRPELPGPVQTRRRKRLKRDKDTSVARDNSEPQISVFKDPEPIFQEGPLWWQVPIDEDELKLGRGHLPGTGCRVCDIIFRTLSPSIIYALLQSATQVQHRPSFVYRLMSYETFVVSGHTNENDPSPKRETRLSIWLQNIQQLVPLVQLNITRKFSVH